MYHISNDKRSLQSSEWIYEALKKLMAEKNYQDIKITDVVSAAQIGRTTFYRSFDTLDDVLRYQCDREFTGCAQYLKKSVFEDFELNHSAPFLLPFMQYWYINFSTIELLIRAKREDLIKESFIRMVEGLRAEFPHVEIQYYNYFVEIRAAIAIALLTEWVKTNRSVPPDVLVKVFEKQILMDKNLFAFVRS